MKILQIIPSLNMGGGEKLAVNLCNELSKDKNNSVILCVISKITNEMLLPKQISKDVTVICLNKSKGFDLSTLFKVNKLINEKKPDIVHTHLRSLMYSFIPIVFSKTRFIHTIHTLANKEAKNYLKRKLYSFYFKYQNVEAVSISDTVRESTIKLFGNKHNLLIENGVPKLEVTNKYELVKEELDSYKLSNETKVLVSIGRVTEVKNQELLISVMSEFHKENKDIILLIIGSLDNEKEYANKCIEKSKNIKNIFFLGEKSNVSDYIYLSNAICISSKYEGHPLIVLESLSLGKTVLSTNVGGIPDILDESNSYLSEDMSMNSYKKIIEKYLIKKDKNVNNIINKFNKNFSIVFCTNRYLNLYDVKNKK